MCGDRRETKQSELVFTFIEIVCGAFFLPLELWECDRLSGKKVRLFNLDDSKGIKCCDEKN